MSRYNYYNHFTPSKPVETDEGIKARSKRGAFAKNWWATRWIKSLEQLVDAGRLRRGRTYARKGQVLTIEETADGVEAKVQGSRKRPYRVSIHIDSLSDAEWDKTIDALAAQAIFSAQLLAGEMPPEIEEAFSEAGVSLFPDKQSQLVTNCSCPDWANPCKHVAAVHYILGERFDEDPFLLFRMRGRSQAQILEAIRARRAVAPADDEAGEEEPFEEPLPAPADFWHTEKLHISTNIKPPVTDLPILKRLGQPNFISDDLQKLLGPAYQTISQSAIRAAFSQADADSDNGQTSDEE